MTQQALNDMMNEKNSFMAYAERIKVRQPLGADIVGAIGARVQALWDMAGLSEFADRLVFALGDRVVSFGSDDILTRVGLGIAIDYDMWYLFNAGNILKFGGKSIEDTIEKMAVYFTEIDDAKPLLSPETKPTAGAYNLSGGSGNSVSFDTLGAKEYTVKEARYEIMQTGGSAVYGSDGPKQNTQDYVGYIAFPVGPLGVMWGISLATDSSLSGGSGGSVKPVDASNGTVQGGELLPPFDLSRSDVVGEKLMSKGYFVEDDIKVELFASEFGGVDNPPLHQWLRYWITEGNTEIIPGEFVGILCRPWPLHCWWFQETSPFLYSGHWVETEFYTSGIVKEVQVIDDDFTPNEGEVGNRYKVWVKNEEIIVKSSDFLEYEVDERVGLLKTWREGTGDTGGNVGPVTDTGEPGNFNWQSLELLNTGEALTETWVIVPAGFYESSGSSVGGV